MTVEPDVAPFFTGDVVISVPFLYCFELLTSPVIDPSGFCLHLVSIGIFEGGVLFFVAEDPPKNENAGCDFAGAGLGLEPKIEIVPAIFGTFTGLLVGAGAGLVLRNMLMVPPILGIFGSGFFAGATLPPNRLKAGAF